MDGLFFVSTTSQRRAQEWERIFGTDILPVRDGRPRLQSVRNQPMLAYDLDLAALHPGQISRLAGHVSRRTGQPYAQALAQVQTAVSYPIEATDDVQIAEAAEQQNAGLPLFHSQPWLRVPHPNQSRSSQFPASFFDNTLPTDTTAPYPPTK